MYKQAMLKRTDTRQRSGRAAAEEDLADLFEQMMLLLVLLGHECAGSESSLTPQQLKLLFVLNFAAEPLAMSEVSQRLGVSPATLTGAAKRLIHAGLLQRERSSQDDRIVKLSLSRAGKKVVGDIREHRRAFFSRIYHSLDIKSRRTLIESHRFIYDTYRRILQARKEKHR